MAKKKKLPGHYCRICGERKSNEAFSGKGHARHICKVCDGLPQEKKNELRYIARIDRIAEKCSRSREDWELLENYAKNSRYPEAAEFAQFVLGWDRNGDDPDVEWVDEEEDFSEFALEEIFLSGLDKELREQLEDALSLAISDFLSQNNFLPQVKHKRNIVEAIVEEVSDVFNIRLVSDSDLELLFDHILEETIEEMKTEGIVLPTYAQSLIVLETERLIIRKFTRDDLPALHNIMEKPEAMYACELGFTKSETRKWLNRQFTRYKKDGYGYFAVVQKETEMLIGQVGLIMSEIAGMGATEIGCVFDPLHWHRGYATEATKACAEFAFDKLGMETLYCSIRPENLPAARICEKLGMEWVGEQNVVYRKKEVIHSVYRIARSR